MFPSSCSKYVALAVLMAFFSANLAFSAGFQLNETSPGLQGAALAGAAAAREDVTALFNNPATLASLSFNQLYIGASRINPKISMNKGEAKHTVNVPGFPGSSISGQVKGKTFEENIGQSAIVPDAYLSWRLNPKMVTGLAITSPFGLSTQYANNSVLRFLAIKNAIKSIAVNPAISYQITPHLAIGLGALAQYLETTFSNFNGPYTGIEIIDRLLGAGSPSYLKGDGWGFGYTLGVVATPGPALRFGIGYRSSIATEINGQGLQYTTARGIVPAPNPNFLFNAHTRVHSFIRTPAVLSLGLLYDIHRFTLKATAQVNFWDSLNHITIKMPQAFATSMTVDTQWSNTLFYAFGFDFHATNRVTLRAGIAFDKTPTNLKHRDARIPDSDRIWTNVGFSYTISKNLSLDGAYSYIFMRDQMVRIVQSGGSSNTSILPLEVNQASAHYFGSAQVVSLGLRLCY